jgi:NHLM bacteriocin system ABC transporter ATP-binding protein
MISGSRFVAGNQPIDLDADMRPVALASGSAAVFAVDRKTGERVFLFSLGIGEPLLPLSAGDVDAWSVVAVPLEISCLQAIGDLADGSGVYALENWLAKIGQALALLRPAGPARTVDAGQSLIVPHGKRVTVDDGVAFVRLDLGGAQLSGVALSAGAIVALVPGLWLEADSAGGEAEWKAIAGSPPLLAAVLRSTLDAASRALFDALDERKHSREKFDRQRFANRQELNAQVTQSALGHLVGISGAAPQSVAAEQSGVDPLFEAVRLVATHLGMAARPAPAGIQAGDPVRAIADASGFRLRTVVLSGDWWQKDSGPFIAFRQDGAPVALLPRKAGWFGRVGYAIIDPRAGTRVAADNVTAADLNAFARMPYRPLPEDLSTRGLLRHALASGKSDLRTIAIAGAAAALLGMAAPQGAAILIGQAIPDSDSNMIWQVAMGMAAGAFGAALFLLTQAVATLRIQTAAVNTLQSGIWDYLLKLGPAFFRGFTAGQLRMRADAVTRIHQMLSADVLRSLFAGVASFLTLCLMLWYSPGLFLLALACGAVVTGSALLGARALYRIQERWQETDELLSGLVLQAINAVSKLRVAGAANRAFSYWAREYSHKQKLAMSIQVIRDRVRVVNMIAPTAAAALGFLYLLNSPLPLGSFLACNAALLAFLASLTSASDTLTGMVLTANLWQRLRTILEAKPEVDSSKTHPGRLRGAIAVENVTFRYRDGGPLILDGVSIRAEPGECIALTGPSGSGKSTLLNLILRFETPGAGAIYMDGRELSSLDIGAVRRQIGVVTQDGRLMAGSLFENICCGGVNTMDQAWEASRAAGLAEDIENMPMGMHTVVSEGGGNLSGGQRQRLLIARALVLKPAILFFDEATSALDNRTQAIVTESLKSLRATRILIAHRLSTIRNADRIYVIEKGRVVQQGRYSELIAENGLFARLASRQNV